MFDLEKLSLFDASHHRSLVTVGSIHSIFSAVRHAMVNSTGSGCSTDTVKVCSRSWPSCCHPLWSRASWKVWNQMLGWWMEKHWIWWMKLPEIGCGEDEYLRWAAYAWSNTWWLIPLSKWVITPIISGLTLPKWDEPPSINYIDYIEIWPSNKSLSA